MPWSAVSQRLIDSDVPWTRTLALIAFLAGMVVNTAAVYIMGSRVQAMRRSGLLVALMLLASAVAWWPTLAFYLPVWFPFGCVVLCMCLSIALVPSSWPLLLLACGIGTFGGIGFGSLMWPQDDPIAQSYVPLFAAGVAFVVMLIGCLAGLLLRRQSISNATWRRTVWVAVLVCVAFGLVSLAFEPVLIQRRLDRNEQLAEERIIALKDAVDREIEAIGFSRTRLGGIPQYGYRLFIIHDAKSGGYTISAVPVKEHLDGTRRFCTDESGEIGCRVEWNGSRYACLPCPK
jgi:MFS family permease